MKSTLKSLQLLAMLSVVVFAITFLSSCDDEETQTAPVVTTGDPTNVTASTATLNGEIVDNGGVEITVSGFVYSSTNAAPTLASDEFTEETTTSGALTSQVEELNSSTTYHVRAYAINSKGVGYGEVVDLVTGNGAPVATNVTITGQAEANKELTATYTYSDPDDDAQGATTFQWYVANDGAGAGEAAIVGATTNKFVVQDAQQGKYIRVGVTPKATAGVATGVEVKSAAVGAIGEATTVTFTYNGEQVTYGIINSATTGKKWLDRNLGAPNAPSAHNDFANYGDLFQWGRGADGHQLVNRNGPNDADMSSVNGTTSLTEPLETSSTDSPGHNKFIVNYISPNDWRNPQNSNLWQGVNGTNNPCPSGWRIPTANEWIAENLGTLTEAYTKLKITFTSQRASDSGFFFQSTTSGRYWTSTVDGEGVFRIVIGDAGTTQSSTFRGNAFACRCIKN